MVAEHPPSNHFTYGARVGPHGARMGPGGRGAVAASREFIFKFMTFYFGRIPLPSYLDNKNTKWYATAHFI